MKTQKQALVRARRVLMGALVLLLVSWADGDVAWAAPQLTEMRMMSPILEVQPQGNGQVLIAIARGTRHGVAVGARGEVYSAGEDQGIGSVVARVEVLEVEEQHAIVRTLPGVVVGEDAVTVKGQVEVMVLLPRDAHQGVLFELLLLGVEFLDNARQPLVDSMELLFDTTGEVERRALAAMVQAGREVVEFTHELKQVQTRTRWKGKSVAEIMSNNSEEDYLEFLRFVSEYPGKYIGTPWKISETYATWLINFSPPAMSDLYAELAAAKPAEMKALVGAMEARDVQSLVTWARRRVARLDRRQAAEALEIEKVIERVIRERGGLSKVEPLVRAEWIHLRAQRSRSLVGKSKETARLYREASDAYWAVGSESSTLEAIVARNNHMSHLRDMERFAEALAELDAIRALQREALTRPLSPLYRAHVEAADVYSSKVAARIMNSQGRYRDVIALLSPLVQRLEGLGATGTRASLSELLELIAAAHNRLGEVEEAERLHQRVAVLAAEVGDSARQAAVAFAIGEMYHASGRYEVAERNFAASSAVAERAGLVAEHAKGLAAEGQALWNMGRLAEALERHGRAMAMRERLGDESGIAWQAKSVAKIQLDSGDREAARAAFERARAAYAKLGRRGDEADVRLELGDLHQSLKRNDLALIEFTAARDTFKQLGQRVKEGTATLRMASARMNQNDHAGAEKLIASAAALLEKTGDKRELANARLWLAQVRSAACDTKGARQLIESVMPKDPASDPSTAISALIDLANLDGTGGAPERGLELALRALSLAEANQDVWRTLNALQAVRGAYSALGDIENQEKTLRRSLELAEQSGNRPRLVSALQNLAWVMVDTGRLGEAKATAERALALAREIDDPYEVAWTLNTLSRVLHGYNDVKGESEALEEASRLMESVHFAYGRAAVLFNRGLMLSRLRDFEGALAGYQEAEKVLGKVCDSQFEVALPTARGEALLMLGRFKEAEAALSDALARARVKYPARIPGLLRTLSRLETDRGRHVEAVAWAEEAVRLEASQSTKTALGRAILGRALVAAGRFEEGRAELAAALERERSIGGAVHWELLYQVAMAEHRRGERAAAIALLKEAVGEIEKSEVVLAEDSAARRDGTKLQVFRLLVKLLLADGQIEVGLSYLERGKRAELRELEDGLGGAGDANAALAIELDVQEKKLQKLLDDELMKSEPNQAKVGQLDTLLVAAKRRRSEFMEKLDRNDALFDRYAVRPLQLEKLQQYLGEGVLVVAPVVLDDSVVVFAMTKDALTHYATPIGSEEVDALVGTFVREMDPKNAVGVRAKASLAKLLPQARRLFDLLLRPAFEAFGTPRTLVVSPTGSLRYLPFAALHDGQQWLVERAAVVSVTALDREKFAQPAPRGGPEMSVMALAPDGRLSASRAELAEVKKALAQVAVFEGKDASSTTLRQKIRVPGYDIVHLATHGRLDAKNPELSNIQLSDVALSYGDIPTLSPTKTKLVVLSACQTAVLTGGSGIEIAGLAYQFQRGQVHSVMATLWEVDDRATAELMGRFYQGVRDGGTYADALAAAQRAMTGDPVLGHPGFWAPFVLMGTP